MAQVIDSQLEFEAILGLTPLGRHHHPGWDGCDEGSVPGEAVPSPAYSGGVMNPRHETAPPALHVSAGTPR